MKPSWWSGAAINGARRLLAQREDRPIWAKWEPETSKRTQLCMMESGAEHLISGDNDMVVPEASPIVTMAITAGLSNPRSQSDNVSRCDGDSDARVYSVVNHPIHNLSEVCYVNYPSSRVHLP